MLPDTKLAVVNWIRAHPNLPAGVTVAGAAPDDITRALPLVAVFRPPSPPPMRWDRWDRALVNVQTWEGTEKAARDVAAAVAAILHEAPGHTVAGVVIQAVTDLTGLGAVPDPDLPDLARQVFTVTVTARAA